MKKTFILIDELVRERALAYVRNAPQGDFVTIGYPSRTLEQNAAQWPILQEIAECLMWPVNGKLEKLTEDEWKDILTAGFRQEEIRLAAGVNGGMVMLGKRTSKFNKKEFSDWLEYLHWFCADRGVELRDYA